MTHDQLQEDLARQLRGNTDRMVWTNTQLGPVGSPRPDVFTVAKSFSRFRTDAYEVKANVSDLRRDVTSGKWQSYRKYSHAVWFAFQKGLVPLDIIPRECGDKLAVLFRTVENAESSLEYRRGKLAEDMAAIDMQKAARQKLAEADAASMAKTLDENMVKLGLALGLAADEITAQRLNAAIVELRGRMQGGGIERAIALLQGLQGVLPANDPNLGRREGW